MRTKLFSHPVLTYREKVWLMSLHFLLETFDGLLFHSAGVKISYYIFQRVTTYPTYGSRYHLSDRATMDSGGSLKRS